MLSGPVALSAGTSCAAEIGTLRFPDAVSYATISVPLPLAAGSRMV